MYRHYFKVIIILVIRKKVTGKEVRNERPVKEPRKKITFYGEFMWKMQEKEKIESAKRKPETIRKKERKLK